MEHKILIQYLVRKVFFLIHYFIILLHTPIPFHYLEYTEPKGRIVEPFS